LHSKLAIDQLVAKNLARLHTSVPQLSYTTLYESNHAMNAESDVCEYKYTVDN
jgi:hypothetical protein